MKNTKQRLYNIQEITFNKDIKLGDCAFCNKSVYENTLFVREGKEVYHFSCYNDMHKKDE